MEYSARAVSAVSPASFSRSSRSRPGKTHPLGVQLRVAAQNQVARRRRLESRPWPVCRHRRQVAETRFQLARHLKTYEFLVKPFSPGDVHRILRIHQRISLPTRVVIVDDSATVRRMVKKILSASLFNILVAEAGNGEDALVKCASGGFDIVFLDCNMPGLDGIETLDGLLSRNPDAKVIMMSGERNDARTALAKERGSIEFLHKPFYAREVDRVLHMAYGLQPPMLDDVADGTFPNLPPLPM